MYGFGYPSYGFGSGCGYGGGSFWIIIVVLIIFFILFCDNGNRCHRNCCCSQ